jgi:fatty acid desaturase
LGRIAIGPLYYAARALNDLAAALRVADRVALTHWTVHAVVTAGLLWWVVGICRISVLEYALLFAWPGTGLALIRSFAEHRSAPDVAARTATIEAGWFMRLLYLNNNLHALHHAEPTGAWHQRPAAYRRQRAEVLARSRYNLVPSYTVLFRNHMLEPKEPLFHPADSRSRGVLAAAAPADGSLATV